MELPSENKQKYPHIWLKYLEKLVSTRVLL